MRFERLSNAATTTLDGAVTDSATSITLTDGSVFPSEGDYRLVIEQEIVLVTARATNVLTVVRGAEGTTAAAHADLTDVHAIITQGAIDRYSQDFLDPYAFDRAPNRLLDINGEILTAADFTSVNMKTSVITDDPGGGITIAMTSGASPDARVLAKAAPATPYTVTAHVLTGPGSNGSPDNANVLGFRESSSGKLSHISYHYSWSSWVQYLDSPTSSGPANSAQFAVSHRADYWLRVEADGTNLKYYLSSDGHNWFEAHSELKTFHFNSGPDQVWWGGDNQGNDGEMIHLLAWAEE